MHCLHTSDQTIALPTCQQETGIVKYEYRRFPTEIGRGYFQE